MAEGLPVFDSKYASISDVDYMGAHITVERGQSLPAEDMYDGAVKATFIKGYDIDGQLIDERGLLERNGLGKLRQIVTEKWKMARVKRAVGKTAFTEV